MAADSDLLPPQHTQVLVIGGGPAGSTAASALARDGLDVVVLEMAQFPRYHIGESLIPSVRHYLRFIGAEDKVLQHGFARKPGSAIKFNQFMQEGYTDFVAFGEDNAVWNVKRSEFDHLLLQHAEESGAAVHQSCRVLSLGFEENDASQTSRSESSGVQDIPGRPTSATYLTASGVKGEIKFDFLVDASGRAGVMSTKYLKNRHYNASLKNVAVWGYWKDAGVYGQGTDRENAPFFEALSDESGWAWFIPLANGLTSVGVVMDQKQVGVRSRACSSATSSSKGSTSVPLRPRPRAGSLATPAFTGLASATSGMRPRASSASTMLHHAISPSPRPSMRSRTHSASLSGAGLPLPTTHELEKGIERDRENSAFAHEDITQMPGGFPVPPPISTWSADRRAAYPSPPLTPLTSSFPSPLPTAMSMATDSSLPTLTRPFMHLRSPSVTGEEITSRKASALAERYLSFLQLAPGVVELIGEGLLVRIGEDGCVVGSKGDEGDRTRGEEGTGEDVPAARTASDYSYSASTYAGDGYRIIGDAGAFIDPFFSSGVHLAMTGALSAAASICASVRGDCTEKESADWCSRRIAVSYTRFLVVVLSAYKQIRSQFTKVLADIDDDNFDKAFTFLRPVIQGSGEMGAKVSEDEVQRALDFCVNLFNPTTPEQHEAVREKLSHMRITIPSDLIAAPPAVAIAVGENSLMDAAISTPWNDAETQVKEEPESPMLSWMDVRAPIINPSKLARMLGTRLRRLSLSGSSEDGESVPSSPSSTSVVSSTSWSSASLSPPPPPPSVISVPESTLGPVTEEDSLNFYRQSQPDSSGNGEGEMKMVLDKVNARRVIHVDHMEGLNSLEQEDVEGFVVRLVRGNLGLVRAERQSKVIIE